MSLPEEDLAALRLEIDRTRIELGDTVAALAAKTDVKARARDAVADLGGQLRQGAAVALRRPVPMVFLGAAAVGAAVVWIIWRRR
jgi:hypothetical protein